MRHRGATAPASWGENSPAAFAFPGILDYCLMVQGAKIILLVAAFSSVRHFVDVVKLHPILVNFTAALIPVSWASDCASRLFKIDSLRATGWWTMLYATMITPFTAAAGWLFWMPDDNGDRGMMIHKWLGTTLAAVLFGLFGWRLKLRRQNQPAPSAYLFAGFIFIVALVVQGYLGGTKVFSG